MTDIPTWFMTGAAVVAFYAILSRGLFLATDPSRQSLIDLAGSLIDSPAVPVSTKRVVASALDDAHSVRSAWALAFMAIRIALTKWATISRSQQPARVPGNMRATWREFKRSWALAVLGNSLGATLLATFAALIAGALRLSVGKLLNALLPKDRGDNDGHRVHHA
jgi:hypothetical protein